MKCLDLIFHYLYNVRGTLMVVQFMSDKSGLKTRSL